ncbi:MAG TPA: VWA domain-containing protein [Nannocystaceae bacterium]|nr:VWA domain-containing protein [Nannocystaceae bacterium]
MTRSSLAPRLALLAGAAIALPQLFACLSHPLKEVEYDKTGIGTKGVAIAINKDVDILFVIDDSGSMAEEQALLAKNFGSFIGVLEAKNVKANYRIGVTTTDHGNPRCPKADTTPPDGDLVLSSCLDRIDAGDFVFNGVDPPLDASFACTDVCKLSDDQLQIVPTATDLDPDPKARPWLENIEGRTNLPEGVSTLEAFQCFGPQGVAGCGFESHLESMYRALTKAETPGESNFGFVRDSAILSVVFLTDELDCSYNEAHKNIFIDNKVFWNSPDDPIPTSAVCYRAGVECVGDGDPSYSDCFAQNYDEQGNPGASDEDAVLHPVHRYVDYVQGIEAAKQKVDNGQEVLVALIGGVPPGYEKGGDIAYSGVADQAFLDDFGIAPGCVLGDGKALPPVRLREFAESFEVGDERNMFSICQDDYSAALGAIAAKIQDQIKPSCMPECVKDTDPTTQILDPECRIEEVNAATETSTVVPLCVKQGGEWVPPDGATVCYTTLVDSAGLTADSSDDLSKTCADEGWNLEFGIFRNGPAPKGSTITASCVLSELPQVDCPGLG